METAPESNLALTLSALHSSSSSSSSNYEVFLSFRGPDTRKTFTDHLYTALIHNGIRTFRDEEELEIGEPIMPNLLKFIQESRISIPIISPDYASSRSCLEELAKIMECKRTIGQTVMPIFYHVDVGDVKNQNGSFAEQFCSHEKRYPMDKVTEWKNALREVGKLKGYDSKNVENGHEAKLVQKVLTEVLNELDNTTHMYVTKYPIGIDSCVEDMLRLLDVGSQDVRFVGVHGMGGLGKTTIAKAVFNKIHRSFDGNAFIRDVREEVSRNGGLVDLQKKLVCDILNLDNSISNQETNSIRNVDIGKNVIKRRMSAKKVLVILDDVDKREQLEALVGEPDWFGSGSRIIITTRDMHVLNVHGVDNVYKPEELDDDQSLQLLSWHAFRSNQPPNDFVDLPKKVALATGGLPLALEVLGSFLFDKSLDEWEDILKKLKRVPNIEIQEKLMISYDALEDDYKDMFLDIACLLIGTYKEIAIKIWEGCDFYPNVGIKVLVQRSLINISYKNTLMMHDQLRDMGRAIVYKECPKYPGKRSRLWCHEEVLDVLTNLKCQGTEHIEGLTVSVKGEVLTTEAFADMSNLRLLRVEGARLVGNFEDLPPQLIWLCLKGCVLDFKLNRFHLEKLVVLDLSETNIVRINWHQNKKVAANLKVISLRGCHYLKEFPTSICNLAFLESLDLGGCYKLTKLPSRLDAMESLTKLLFRGSAIEKLPDSIGLLKNLKRLDLYGCGSLTRLPDSLGKLESLRDLWLDNTSIREIPDSIGSLKKLWFLSVSGCRLLTMLPNSIGAMESLTVLFFDGSAIEQLPDSIGHLKNLTRLGLEECRSLTRLPDSLGKLESLGELYLGNHYFNLGYQNLKSKFRSPYKPKFISPYEPTLDSNGTFKLINLSLPDLINNNMRNLTFLGINGITITELPDSFGSLEKLESLEILKCKLLGRLPDSIGNLRNLKSFSISEAIITELPDALGSLEKLEKLEIEGCTLLDRLPDSIGNLINLEYFSISEAIITELPDAFGSLEKLEDLAIRECKLLGRLPDWIGNLRNLKYFSISEAIITELPDSFGSLQKLERLMILECKLLGRLPDSIGNLRNLKSFSISKAIITELPDAFGSLEKLEDLNIKECELLGGLPDSIGNLRNLKSFSISKAIITELPDTFGLLEKLEDLEIGGCKLLGRLPDSIGNLRNLKSFFIREAIITELPDAFGSLEKLEKLLLFDCKKLVKLPDSMGKLKRLQTFVVWESSIVELPKDFVMLSSLKDLEISDCQEFKCFPDIFGSLTQLTYLILRNNSKLTVLPPSLSRLSSLKELYTSHCNLPDVFGELSSPERCALGYNNFRSLPTSISGISLLQYLSLRNCTELAWLPELPTSLKYLDLTNCISMETLPDLSNLKRLRELSLVNCDKLPEIQGLQRLESLEILHMAGCSTFANTLKKSLSQGVFKGLCGFSFPGSEIPKWFTHQEILSGEVLRVGNSDDEIEGLILCLTFAIDENIDDLHQPYATTFIQHAELQIWSDHKQIYSKCLYIPKAHQDNIYLQYFKKGYGQFLKKIKYGDQIQFSTSSPLETPGFHVKKAGVHVVYKPKEGFDNDEIESAIEENSHQSVLIAEKLSEFFTSSACSCGINEGESTSVKGANKRGRDDEDEEIVRGKSKRNVPFRSELHQQPLHEFIDGGDNNCAICSEERIVGEGDVKPFIDVNLKCCDELVYDESNKCAMDSGERRAGEGVAEPFTNLGFRLFCCFLIAVFLPVIMAFSIGMGFY